MKRLVEADGYLDLGMTRQALATLDAIDEPGGFLGAIEFLRGKALWLENRIDDAADSLRFAAEHTRAPFNRPAWLALSAYYHDHGLTDQAIDSLAHARGANNPSVLK
jgi:hypothetical protein